MNNLYFGIFIVSISIAVGIGFFWYGTLVNDNIAEATPSTSELILPEKPRILITQDYIGNRTMIIQKIIPVCDDVFWLNDTVQIRPEFERSTIYSNNFDFVFIENPQCSNIIETPMELIKIEGNSTN